MAHFYLPQDANTQQSHQGTHKIPAYSFLQHFEIFRFPIHILSDGHKNPCRSSCKVSGFLLDPKSVIVKIYCNTRTQNLMKFDVTLCSGAWGWGWQWWWLEVAMVGAGGGNGGDWRWQWWVGVYVAVVYFCDFKYKLMMSRVCLCACMCV